MSSQEQSIKALLPNPQQRARLRKIRYFKDQFSKYGIMAAGMAVVFSLGLIFFYLFSEVGPLLRGASVDVTNQYSLPAPKTDKAVAHLTLERYEEIGAIYYQQGEVDFFRVGDGQLLQTHNLNLPADLTVTSFAKSVDMYGSYAYGLNNGHFHLIKTDYEISYPQDKRQITPVITYPLGDQAIQLDEQGAALTHLAIQPTSDGMTIAAMTADKRLLLGVFSSSKNFITGEITLAKEIFTLPGLPVGMNLQKILLDETGQHMILATDKSQIFLYKISDPTAVQIQTPAVIENGKITAIEFLVGTGSIVIGTDEGYLSQWFLVRDDNNIYALKPVRTFKPLSSAIKTIAPEYSRRGFWALDSSNQLGIYFATSNRQLFESAFDKNLDFVAVSPINGKAILLNNQLDVMAADVWNKHPEVSFSSLWEKVWYEGRQQPEYIWQASSGSDNFEAKMSFVPLSIGTLKAAFFAILFAVPLGVMGAIYTAYFMTPKLRGIVKPTIEIMAALPTVILGFLAGLWLAPFMENHLPAIFSILILLPVVMLVTGFIWSKFPSSIRTRIPEGWEATIVVLPLILCVYFCVSMSPLAEIWFFNGSMRQWFTDNGIDYDQRNALVVGVIMGFAVIPGIFSIAEDAVFSVPRHLTQGSLALGATPWQTMVGVVLPTASPGIFSAVMIGFGRAVGETMIVLMATGNSPVVNFNIFEGMRTLSANIAVELPETAVDSTHFRVLFLAALLLLALTFVVNTMAEIVRQRLRARYSNL